MIRRLALVPLLAASVALAAAEPRISIPTANGEVALSLVVDGFALPAAAGLPPSVRQLGTLSGHRRVVVAQAGDPGLPRLEQQARELERQVGAPVLALARISLHSQPLIVTRELVLRLHPGADPAQVLAGEDAAVRGPHPALARAWVVTAGGGLLAAIDCAARLATRPGVVFAEPVVHQVLAHKDDPSGSPLYGPAAGGVPSEQWHLNPALGGTHIDVQPVWDFAAGANLGAGAVLNVVDDGVDAHPGFGANLVGAWGYSYRSNTAAITLTAGDRHGTVVAGLAAARDGTGFGLGVAPRATLVPVQQADALYDGAGIGHNLSADDAARRPWVVNCSWGPSDDGSTWAPMSLTFQAVLDEAVTGGRSGRGVVYCVAAGNGRASGDNANYDEWAIGRQTIGVGAITKTGVQASYSEDAAGLLVCAPGGDSDDVSTGVYCAPADRGGMATIDRVGAAGYVAGDYTVTANLSMRGTSFATPVVAGAASLILAAHPELGYRDLLHLFANHSQRIDAADAGVADAGRRWQRNNPAGAVRRWHSVRYGFGCVDVAKAMGAVAAGWVPVPALTTQRQGGSAFTVAGGTSASQTLALTPTGGALVAEHVTLEVQFEVAQRRSLTFRLASPAGSVSYIQGRSTDFESATAGQTYRFTSVVHWGEDPAGSWTLSVDNGGLGQAQIASWALAVNGYHPYPVPASASVFPATFAAPASGSVSLLVTSAGAERSGTGAVATRATLDGSAVTVAWDDGSHALVTIPVALLGLGGHSLVLRNGVFDSQFTGTPGAYGTVSWVAGAAIPLTVVDSASVPAAPVISAPGAGATVANRRPAIGGTTTAGTTVRIYEGSALLGTASVTGTAWSLVPASDLALGSHALTVFASDGSGATGQPAEVAFTITDPPVPPVVPPPAATTTTTTQQLLIAQSMQSSSSSGGCGLGGMGALVAALAVMLMTRRRPR